MEVKLFEITCVGCGISFWITNDYDDRLRKDHKNFFCPNGHSQWYPGKTDGQKLSELEREKNAVIARLERELKKKKRKPRKIKEPKK